MEERSRYYRGLSVLCVGTFLLTALMPKQIQAAVIADRIKAVTRTYPSGSYYNGYMKVDCVKDGVLHTYIGHECAGFVMYVTDKAFQRSYCNGSPDYLKIYKTVSTKDTRVMKQLFAQAKIGDVVRWTGHGGQHQAIFLEATSSGVLMYEANFGTDYNRVWYRHLWPWDDQALWRDTSSAVSVYHYKDYEKLDRAVKKVSIDKKKLILKKGKKSKLRAAATPSSAYDKKVIWISSNPKVAKVNAQGTVKGVKKGRASITALARDGSGKKAVCKVIVR